MSDFNEKFEAFNLTDESAQQLRSLAKPSSYFVEQAERIIVETVVVEDGNRRVINVEAACAKLV